jgi:hypothetical protein
MNQASRFNDGKPPLSYLLDFPNAIKGVAVVCDRGAKKYSKYNWKKGLPYTGVIDSLLRHTTAFQNGEDLDPEDGIPHVDRIVWNALALAEYWRSNPEHDDRYKPTKEVKENE